MRDQRDPQGAGPRRAAAPSPHGEALGAVLILVVAGPGGVGKGTVAERLLIEDERLWLSRSWTTRARRSGEAADAYVFVDRDEFQARVDAGGFLEHAEFLGNLYGTPVPDPPPGLDVILEIDVQGAGQVLDLEPTAQLVFLLPPSTEELERRLRGRGDPDDVVGRRLAHAADEEARARALGATFLVNDDLDRTVADLHALLADVRAKSD